MSLNFTDDHDTCDRHTAHVTRQRDQARDIAADLEAQLEHLRALLGCLADQWEDDLPDYHVAQLRALLNDPAEPPC